MPENPTPVKADHTLPTLVFIPGLISDKRVWQPLEAALPGFPVHHADVKQDSTIEAMASRILQNVAQDCIVVGHSMGGRVAMEVARQAPSRVAGLVLANTGHNAVQPGEREKREAKIEEAHADFPAMVAGWLPPMVAASRHDDKDLISNLTQMALSVGPTVHEQQMRALIARPDVSTYLPGLTCPILLMTGHDDMWSPIKQHREMFNMATNATLKILEGAGHFMPVEQPAATVRVILEWFEDLNIKPAP